MMSADENITLVTGANRGMGFEIAKELGQKGQHVIIGARNLGKGQDAIEQLTHLGIKADVVQLDVTNPSSVKQAAQTIETNYGYLSILINNAGAVFDFRQAASTINLDDVRQDFEINYFGLIDVTEKMVPLLKKSSRAKIINISSMMGSKTAALDPSSTVYRAVAVGYQSAKAAANMYTVQLAKEFINAGVPITVNAIDPGMVATEFGGVSPEVSKAHGGLPVSEGVARTVELATDSDSTITATFSNIDGNVGW
ncbi:SDR family NAD(P)-dependent oxidoreductase [Paucilactobacillus suebicus]|uniref:Carbonyl reductase n=1 Tax=Paucilactobacillus suebicus DSM 5007 = KCTC 3549 TaxID=1423807 RepID=A0A0R1W754_9LACO|nr:SDR family NAD(P)-dependent oxidoreductase [Paucilactobacillus suebicus]KRM11819.1 carbonyl reductase [Paucilactobacillus suebicus DSM 5007 = KCTC 3549]